MLQKILIGCPSYNEAKRLLSFLKQLGDTWQGAVVIIDDGSTDESFDIIRDEGMNRWHIIRNQVNIGYGSAIYALMQYGIEHNYKWLVTLDTDLQHDIEYLPYFLRKAEEYSCDVISGSRYLPDSPIIRTGPSLRKLGNLIATSIVNELSGLNLSDAWCGYKAYRLSALRKIKISSLGYGMPLEFWLKGVSCGLSIVEIAVPLIYTDKEFIADQSKKRRSQLLHDVMDSLSQSIQDIYDIDLKEANRRTCVIIEKVVLQHKSEEFEEAAGDILEAIRRINC